eukprot:TRINITY_DN6753_c0_g1_i2.p9 TRINITY_DN6753_c0_g1~~TRINITY_DN6753_c0_g1_i2.p9  ORF type:complete len:112 (+),score=6.38 TRINITY_DN6753_c0_g1_i2:1407-1742(+)
MLCLFFLCIEDWVKFHSSYFQVTVMKGLVDQNFAVFVLCQSQVDTGILFQVANAVIQERYFQFLNASPFVFGFLSLLFETQQFCPIVFLSEANIQVKLIMDFFGCTQHFKA